jgi:ribonuclease E
MTISGSGTAQLSGVGRRRPDRKDPSVPSKNPLGKIKDMADAAVSTAVGTAVSAVGAVASKVPVPGRGRQAPTPERTGPRAVPQQAEAKVHGDPLAPVEKAPVKKAPAKKLASAGTPDIPTPGETALSKKATTTKRPAAKKTVTKKTVTKKAPGKKAPEKKATAKKTPAPRQSSD